MNAAFMLYEQAGRGRGRAGLGSREPARSQQHHKPETAKHQNALDPGFHGVLAARRGARGAEILTTT